MYRFLVSLWMMLLYLSVTVGADVVSLTCRCKCNHSADVHTAFAHTHSCHCEDESCGAHDNCQGCLPMIGDDGCNCHHNHSTEIKLYTQPRSVDEDSLLRSLTLWAVVAYAFVDVEIDAISTGVTSYNRYLLPPLLGAHSRGVSLRAPPALV
jgi:hypothetical protein